MAPISENNAVFRVSKERGKPNEFVELFAQVLQVVITLTLDVGRT
ncbi:hypothetical protein [uncultured Nitrosomonas sp.]|nr:hypothetical protein [uncultured Nitrosomonas sp.]